jgi:hypothetical protein
VSEIEWKPATEAPEGEVVATMIADGSGVRNFAKLRRRGNLWYVPDGSMYVYYTPTHYHEASPTPTP